MWGQHNNRKRLWISSSAMDDSGDASLAAAAAADGSSIADAGVMMGSVANAGQQHHERNNHYNNNGEPDQSSDLHHQQQLPLHSTTGHHQRPRSFSELQRSRTPATSINNWYPPQQQQQQHHGNCSLFQRSHESFLEEMARQECQNLPCKEHRPSSSSSDADASNNNNNRSEYDLLPDSNDEEGRKEERRRFMLLDFESDNDDTSDSDEDSSTEEDDEGDDDDDVPEHDNDNNDGGDGEEGEDGDNDDQNRNIELDNNNQLPPADEGANQDGTNSSNQQDPNNVEQRQRRVDTALVQQLLSNTSPLTFNMTTSEKPQGPNINTQRISSLLLSLANSEEQPLIRADIPWSIIISCGSPFMQSAQQHYHQQQNKKLPTTLSSHLSPSLMESPAVSKLKSKPSLLRTLYQQMRDPNGARLLQGVLRMDPPLEAVKVLLDAFPLACLDMEGFFTACQFAHPNTSHRSREYYGQRDVGRGCGFATARGSQHDNTQLPGSSHDATDDVDDDEVESEHETDDVGEVVKLVMRQTIRARRLNSIDWGMVAFLGDARISPSHAKLLLRHAPEALIDPKHGAFGVSPLDRMSSGFFIHGETNAWVEKLRLALRVAAYVREKQLEREEGKSSSSSSSALATKISLPKGFFTSSCQLFRRRESTFDAKSSDSEDSSFPAQSFYPYHELIRLLVSPNFQGNKFGQHGFLQTLRACTQSDPDAFLRPDNEGNLPIHIALRSECNTVLGVKGERRLIKYLLDLDHNTALCPEGIGGYDSKERRLPLRLSVKHAWPVYDLIISSALASCADTPNNVSLKYEGKNPSPDLPMGKDDGCPREYILANMIIDRPLLHDALDGPYHPRFGIHGARQLVKNIISKITHHHHEHHIGIINGKGHHCLTNFVDANGRTALHIALESKWPVYDLIVQANPFCLEARDPTQQGFFPFQIAACAFTASYPTETVVGTAQTQSETKEQQTLPVLGIPPQANRSISTGTAKDDKAVGDQKDAALVEMSMLFELIRESPLCVTWRMPNENQCDAKQRKDNREGLNSESLAMDTESFSRRSKKRRQPFSPSNIN